jgi:dihydroceramide fatty acyl 2-hydroxylase
MAFEVLIFGCGVFAWTFLEYAIHAWLGHQYDSFARPLHLAHHRDPHAVFTIGAWIPVALTWAGGIALWGFTSGMIFYSGMVAGFMLYETVHYRIHFKQPRNRLERHLRARHLLHHYGSADACFGVTSALWDALFATESDAQMRREWVRRSAVIPPLGGHTNLRRLLYFGVPAR